MNQADRAKARSSVGVGRPAHNGIALIVIFREKYARRILAIVSTISISNSAS
jgi:hypothetical protein